MKRNLLLIPVLVVVLTSIVFANQAELTPIQSYVEKKVSKLCESSSFASLFAINDNLDEYLQDHTDSVYFDFLRGLQIMLESILPGCYDEELINSGEIDVSTTLTLPRLESMEASDGGKFQDTYYRNFYHIHYGYDEEEPVNPVLMITVPDESGCLLGVGWRNEYSDVYISEDNGETWEKRISTDPYTNYGDHCPQVTHIKVLPGGDLSKTAKTSPYYGSNTNFVYVHLGLESSRPQRSLCIDILYSADNAQYIEDTICELSDEVYYSQLNE